MDKPQTMEAEMRNSAVLRTLNSESNSINIGPFSETLQPLINEALAEGEKDKYRKGTILTPVLLVWFILSMTLRRDLDYNKTLNWLVSGIRWLETQLPAKLVSCGTISHARVQLGFEVIRSLFCKFVASLQPYKPDFHGFTSVIFDGSGLTMPDTKSNQAEFGKPKTGRGKAAFPQTRIMALMVRATRIVTDIAFAPFQGKGTGERSLMMEILQRTKDSNLLFLFDAGFYSFYLIYALQQKGHHFLMKISSSIQLAPVKGGLLSDGSYLALIKGKIEDPLSSTPKRRRFKKIQILVRVIQFQIPGFQPVRLITNIMDVNITAKELACHYHKRWDIEIGYDEIKTHQCATLRGHCPTHLRSKRSDLVKQEIYAILIVYNQIRFLMYQAALTQNQNPLDISFLDTTQWIIDAVPEISIAALDMRKSMFDYLLRIISESTVDRPRRPRINPRVVKVKMSKFSLKRQKHKSEERHLDKEITIVPLANQQAELKEAS
jgi:hypothetical protein